MNGLDRKTAPPPAICSGSRICAVYPDRTTTAIPAVIITMTPGSFSSGAAQRNGFLEVLSLGDNLSYLHIAISKR